MISSAAELDLASGILVSLLVTGLANSSNIIANPEGVILEQISKLLETEGYVDSVVDETTGGTHGNSNVGLKITLRTKVSLYTYGYEDTASRGMGRRDTEQGLCKISTRPSILQRCFFNDSQMFESGAASIANDKLATIFGWNEELNLARKGTTAK